VERVSHKNYVEDGTIPSCIPAGAVLVHNHIRHSKNTPSGENGFRAWYQESTDGLVGCRCGWARIAHYRVANLLAGR
jgi:hypothetical protein